MRQTGQGQPRPATTHELMIRTTLRSPVSSKLFHRHAMLHESHERTNGRPTAQWS